MRTVITLLCAAAFAVTGWSASAEKIRILLDTDANNELDDQHAIAYMLFNGDIFDVEGITVNGTSGGGGVEKDFEEAERVVKLCASYSLTKVYRGAAANYEDILPEIDDADFDGAEAVNFIIERAHAEDDRKLLLMPIGKLTNISLALKKDPSIADKVKIVWLGTNYPKPGEYNFVNDIGALDPIMESNVEFEMAMVRYDEPSGTDAVAAKLVNIQKIMPGKGPVSDEPVTGRHGGTFTNFGDYSVELFEKFEGHPTERPLFDMAAIAIVKDASWADRVEMGAPKFADGKWTDRPDNPRRIVIWENFDKDAILKDFYTRMSKYVLITP
jgi:inosine-uridine nucleoside N-ribohydrolase